MSDRLDALQCFEPSFRPWQPHQPVTRQVVVLMSGGVDSSVTARLLQQDGWDVLGITMKIPTCRTGARGCCGADAALVCHDLDICHYFVDVTAAFQACIITPFRQAYQAGRTPNPCIDCNTELKFTRLWDFVQEKFGVRYLATGHYARVMRTDSGTYLARGKDTGKDQSYFLYGIPRQRLPDLLLPLGEYHKEEVRNVAAQIDLRVAEKPESMELCFAGEEDYRNALDNVQRHRPGPLTDMQGRVLGTHQGIANYTLGQRKGLGYAGGHPLYVGRIDPRDNTVALGTRDELHTPHVSAGEINLLQPEALESGANLWGKIRSYGEPSPCRVVSADDTALAVEFAQPVFAPCPGQRLVLYDDQNRVVAGGTIQSSGLAETAAHGQ